MTAPTISVAPEVCWSSQQTKRWRGAHQHLLTRPTTRAFRALFVKMEHSKMKRILIAAVAVAAVTSGSNAFAAPNASATISMSGSSPNTCVLGKAAVQGAAVNMALGTDAQTRGTGARGNTAVTITDLASASEALLQNASITLRYANSYCNMAHEVGIQSINGGFINSTAGNDPVAGSGDFIQRVGYTSNLAWAGGTAVTGPAPTTSTTAKTADTDAAAVGVKKKAPGGSNRGALDVTIAITADTNNPVVAGSYSETINVLMGVTV